ncbi:MAG: ligase-associated DNA damage response endonuclease PdeM [Bryobacterales bacterium]
MEIELAGERLEMLPQRALHWAAESTLFIADTHWGKAASFRALSIPVPVGSTTEDLERLDLALERSGAQRLVVLGDLIHARQGRRPETFEAVKRWLDRKPDLELWLVRGNHDRAAGDPPEEWNFRIVDEPHALGPFALRHRPALTNGLFTLCGHTHPKLHVRGFGGESIKAPCFQLSNGLLTLPAFSSFADGG